MRMTGVLGIGWIVLSMVAFFIQGEGPALDANAGAYLDWAEDRGDNSAIAMGLTLVGAVLGLGFFASVGAAAMKLASAVGATLMGGGLVALSLMCVSMAIYLGPLFVLDHHEVSAPTMQVMYITGTYVWLVASAGVAAAMAAAALLARSTSVLPGWSMWIAGLVAIASVVALLLPVSTATILPGTLGLYVWVLAVSIAMVRSVDDASAA